MCNLIELYLTLAAFTSHHNKRFNKNYTDINKLT